MFCIKERKELPYWQIRKNLADQLKKSAEQRKVNKTHYLIKKIKNYLLASLAFNCPVNSWRISMHKWRGVNIGEGVFIGLHCTLDHAYPEYIYMEDFSGLSGDNYIVTHSNPAIRFKDVFPSYVAPVILRKGAWLGIKTTILPDVEIGENAVVSAGLTINKNVPSKSIVLPNKYKTVSYEQY